MSICAEIDNGGYLIQSVQSLQDCSHFVVLSATEYGLISSMAMPTPAELLYLYTWGMGAVLLPWSIAYAVGVAKRVISKT
jgi:hypothetical protein